MISILLSLATFVKPEVSTWIVGYNLASVNRFEERANQIDTAFMEYYAVSKDGLPVRRTGNRAAFLKSRAIAKKHHVQILAMISNYEEGAGNDGFDPIRMSKAVASVESRSKFAHEIVSMLKEDQADGVDFDLESLKGEDRDRYSALVATTAKELHKVGLKLSVTVHAKDEVVGTWDGVKAQDYKALGASADRFNVMTYDYSWSTSVEGSIAPTEWVEKVIKFTLTQVPAHKIGMGVACYGYDWSKKPAASLAWSEFTSKGAKVDPSSGELWNGKVHFSGSDAFRQKYLLANKLGIASVAFWYCGSEDPAIWTFLPTRR